jgi:hypothetical protein
VYFILNYEVAFALVFLCAGAHKLVSAFLLEVINSCIILAREFCACCALNTLKVPTRYRHGYRLRDNGEPALMGAFCVEVSGELVGKYLNSLYRESLHEDPEPVEKRS